MKEEEINGLDLIECIQYKWFKTQDLKKKISGIADLNRIAQDSRIIDNVKLLDSSFNKIKMCLTVEENRGT